MMASRRIVKGHSACGIFVKLALLALLHGLLGSQWAQAKPTHALTLQQQARYQAGFAHFDYVNPDAPKGGRIKLSAIGTFDTLNGYLLKGTPPSGLGLIYDTLGTASMDEPFSYYGLVAEKIEVEAHGKWVQFFIHPQARFHDGRRISPQDVVWTFETLMKHGDPLYRAYYADVERVEVRPGRVTRFYLRNRNNPELPLILCQLPVLPKHYWNTASRDFTKADFTAPLGSGPYRIADYAPGRWIEYERVSDYWGEDLGVNVGQHNVNRIRYDYYRDRNVAIEAFKSGDVDFFSENNAARWARGYEIPAVKEGRIKRETIKHQRNLGLQAFFFNTRKPLFADRRVREALSYAFDFEWMNKTLFYGQYTRSKSYFSNSEFAARKPADAQERALIESLRARVPAEIASYVYEPPVYSGNGNIRSGVRKALRLLRSAGWKLEQGVLRKEGQAFRFEILIRDPSFERIVLPFIDNLKKLGIDANMRLVDTIQYKKRVDARNFDMISIGKGQSESPGNEQRDYWGSQAAQVEGSGNYAGINDPAIDEVIAKIIEADSREALVRATRLLDRLLTYGMYVIPQWHYSNYRIAYWNRFARKHPLPAYSLGFPTIWWVDPERNKALR